MGIQKMSVKTNTFELWTLNLKILDCILFCKSGFFRLILASCVIISHTTNLEIGRIAVLVFFLQSGYWVLDIWKNKFELKSLFIFYISRYLRVAPLYFLGMYSMMRVSGTDMRPDFLYILGMSNVRFDPLWVSWSLDIELQFYLLLPVFAALINRHAFFSL